ncbi:MAG: O-acetyl-ADP-ribose deacetylase [Pseudomonadota bacterium]
MASEHDKIEIVEADITTLAVDAIVNAANDRLRPGGGVCGAIHRAAGPELARACAAIGACPTGAARITKGFGLPAKYVIHAVGPVWKGGGANEVELLASCYRESLRLAAGESLASIAFPAISTGIYGFPAPSAAGIAVRAVADSLRRYPVIERVIFCCFGKESAALHRQALAGIAKS